MESSSFVRVSLAITCVLVMLGASAAASAGQSGFFTLQHPALNCQTGGSPSLVIWTSELQNHGTAAQLIYCPIDLANGQGPTDVHFDFSPGWANLQTCSVEEIATASGSLWFFGGSSVSHNSSTNADTVNFSGLPQVSPMGALVQCNVAAGQAAFDYSERVQQYFDWTSW